MISKMIGNFMPILKNGLTSMSISNIPELALIVRFLRTIVLSQV